MAHENPTERGHRQLREGGYKRHDERKDIHADAKADAKMVARGVHQHEANMRKGHSKTKLKLKRGGHVRGEHEKERPDQRRRGGMLIDHEPDDNQGNTELSHASARARGGATKHKGKTIININTAPKGDPEREKMAAQQGLQKGVMVGKQMAAQGGGGAPPPHPPQGPPMAPPGGGMPPGAMPGGGGMPPPHPPMPPPGAPPMRPPGMRTGGIIRRDEQGRFSGGAL